MGTIWPESLGFWGILVDIWEQIKIDKEPYVTCNGHPLIFSNSIDKINNWVSSTNLQGVGERAGEILWDALKLGDTETKSSVTQAQYPLILSNQKNGIDNRTI